MKGYFDSYLGIGNLEWQLRLDHKPLGVQEVPNQFSCKCAFLKALLLTEGVEPLVFIFRKQDG